MKSKKIIADSMPQALKMVRQKLGENAIIVNTRTIRTGGVFGLFSKQKFEVTAYSIDKNEVLPSSPVSIEWKETPGKALPKESGDEREMASVKAASSGFHKQPQKLYGYYSQTPVQNEQTKTAPEPASVPVSSDKNDNPLLDELQHLRKMMMTIMMSEKQKNALPPEVTKWVDRLKEQGVEDEVIFHIVNGLLKKEESLSDLDEKAIKLEITSTIIEIISNRMAQPDNVTEAARMVNMIGPTGVGKTTTIAKLATEQILKQKRRVAMITTDVYRIAAVEQLRTYAGILNVPLEVVRTKEELEDVINKLKHYDLIYMDTTGRNYKEQANMESVSDFLYPPLASENYLVLSLTTKFEDLKVLLDRFRKGPVKKLILTKIDETTSYGSILNIAYKYPYQLAYITNGQSVPEDITTVDASQIASFLLGEEKEDGSSPKSS